MSKVSPLIIDRHDMHINDFRREGITGAPPQRRTYLNLSMLAEHFPLDGVQYTNTEIKDDGSPGFKSIKYLRESEAITEQYRKPPTGPISRGCYCQNCGRKGPKLHKERCLDPRDMFVRKIDDDSICPKHGQQTTGALKNAITTMYRWGGPNSRMTTVRVHPTGTITITHSPKDDFGLAEAIIAKINDADKKSGGEVITDEYTEDFGFKKYRLFVPLSYVDGIGARMRMESPIDFIVDLQQLNDILYKKYIKKGTARGGSVSRQFLTNGQTAFPITPEGEEYYREDVAKTGRNTRPMIIFNLIYQDAVKISIKFEKRGSVQFWASLCGTKHIRNKKCYIMANPSFHKLDDASVQIIAKFIKDIIINEYDSIIVPFTIGRQKPVPMNPRTHQPFQIGDKIRQPRTPVDDRPDPYTYKRGSKCPYGKFSAPWGWRRDTEDHLWEPRCVSSTSSAQREYRRRLMEGFPLPEDMERYSVGGTKEEDRQRTINKESRYFKGVQSMNQPQLERCLKISANRTSEIPSIFTFRVIRGFSEPEVQRAPSGQQSKLRNTWLVTVNGQKLPDTILRYSLMHIKATQARTLGILNNSVVAFQPNIHQHRLNRKEPFIPVQVVPDEIMDYDTTVAQLLNIK